MHARELTRARAQRLRNEMTPPEVRLWQCLRARRLHDLKFRRQHPIGPWIVDFYCVPYRLAVEVDGQVHALADNPERDARRDAWLADRGVRVFRVSAGEVMRNLDGVLQGISRAVFERELIEEAEGPLSHLQCREPEVAFVGAPGFDSAGPALSVR